MRFRGFERFVEKWAVLVERQRLLFLLFFVLLAGASLYAVVTRMGFNSDVTDLISHDLEFHKNWVEYKEAYPQLVDNYILVIEGADAKARDKAAEWVVEKVQSKPEVFETAYRLNGGSFYENNALLFQETENVAKLSQSFKPFEPMFENFSRNPKLSGFIESFSPTLRDSRSSDFVKQLTQVFEGQRKSIDYSILFGTQTQAQEIQFIEVKARMNYNDLLPAEKSFKLLKSWIADYPDPSIDFGLTGTAALSYQELQTVSKGAGISGLISLILVSLILFWALRSFRLIFVSIASLLMGLILTGGFAAVAIGHLNVISIAFAVLFIGLGVDYSLHLCLRYRELISEGWPHIDALKRSVSHIGSSLLLCSLTTAVGFYAFVPTDYSGVSELGIISGTGMFINLFVHLVFFPALLSVFRLKTSGLSDLKSSIGGWISAVSYKNYIGVRYASVGLVIVLSFFAFEMRFDANPLNLQDDEAEAFQVYRDLLKKEGSSPWTIKILESDPKKRDEIAQELKKLTSVEEVIQLGSFIPENQSKKLSYLKQLPSYQIADEKMESREEANQMLRKFSERLNQLSSATEDTGFRDKLNALQSAVDEYLQAEADPSSLESALIEPSKDFAGFISRSAKLNRLSETDLPPQVLNRYFNGQEYRIEVFPKDDLMDMQSMRAFAADVLAIDSRATDDPVTLPLTGDAVLFAFIEALLIAFVAIGILVFVLTRRLGDMLLVLAPLACSGVIITGVAYLFGLSFNFANVVALPLLLGIGVDSGIHMLHRFRSSSSASEALFGSTSRAVFFSALTTIASFGSLSISAHRGTASMGLLLTIGTIIVMLTTLSLLPALLHRKEEPEMKQKVA